MKQIVFPPNVTSFSLGITLRQFTRKCAEKLNAQETLLQNSQMWLVLPSHGKRIRRSFWFLLQPSRSSRSRDSSLSASERNYSASPMSDNRRSSSGEARHQWRGWVLICCWGFLAPPHANRTHSAKNGYFFYYLHSAAHCCCCCTVCEHPPQQPFVALRHAYVTLRLMCSVWTGR